MRKQLANRESKMATAAMADADVDNANRNNFSRPLHKAAPLQMAIFVQICNMCLQLYMIFNTLHRPCRKYVTCHLIRC